MSLHSKQEKTHAIRNGPIQSHEEVIEGLLPRALRACVMKVGQIMLFGFPSSFRRSRILL